MYAQDYDELLPHYADHDCTAGRKVWNQLITPYVKNTQIFYCPSAPTVALGIGVNYPHIINCGVITSTGVPIPGVALATIQFPAQAMLLCDSQQGYLVYCRICWPNGPRAGEETGRVPLDRHNEGCNVGFCDGHAKWMKSTQIIYPPAPGTTAYTEFERFWGHRLN